MSSLQDERPALGLRHRFADPSLTIDEFCAAENVCRSKLYQLWKQGRGPRFFLIGNRRRISHEARVEWRRELEREADNKKVEPHAAPTANGKREPPRSDPERP
jgi:hypothetical protein